VLVVALVDDHRPLVSNPRPPHLGEPLLQSRQPRCRAGDALRAICQFWPEPVPGGTPMWWVGAMIAVVPWMLA
jgi:hypothetical protein